MIVKTNLEEIHAALAQRFEKVDLKGHGPSSFIYASNNGRAVEISKKNGGFWLEFWEKSDDEDAGPVKELTVESGEGAIHEAAQWLR